jgi:hypothetical protein
MADRNATAAKRTFQYEGFFVRTDYTLNPKGKNAVSSDGPIVRNRPDALIAGGLYGPLQKEYKFPYAAHVEFKCGGKSFDVRNLRDGQIEYMRFYGGATGIDNWIYFTMGEDRVNATGANKTPARSWIIPLWRFVEVRETLIKLGIYSLPYHAFPNTATELKEQKLTAVEAFEGYELEWVPEGHLVKPMYMRLPENQLADLINYGMWVIPDDHAFNHFRKEPY